MWDGGGGVAVPNGPENCLVPFCHPAGQVVYISCPLKGIPTFPRVGIRFGPESIGRSVKKMDPARVWFRTWLAEEKGGSKGSS
jgi:hypothetical protein